MIPLTTPPPWAKTGFAVVPTVDHVFCATAAAAANARNETESAAFAVRFRPIAAAIPKSARQASAGSPGPPHADCRQLEWPAEPFAMTARSTAESGLLPKGTQRLLKLNSSTARHCQ